MATDNCSFVDFTEAIAHKLFNGYLPMNVSPELLSVAILESCPPFQGASAEVRKYFLLRLVPLIYFRQQMQRDALEANGESKWLA
jgi:hypothetical protein